MPFSIFHFSLAQLFQAHPNGSGLPYKSPKNIAQIYSDSLNAPDIDFDINQRDHKTTSENQLTDDYKLTLRIFWDDNFNDKFGSMSSER